MLVDLRPKDLTGKMAEKTLDQAGITVNKNTIPDDAAVPFVTSGIRLGTPSVTTQGMEEAEMAGHRLVHLAGPAVPATTLDALAAIKADVAALCARFPAYP